ncbi:MAG: hypothetical protein FJ150_05610 [Euryarchaeota archaeon]|nr:hypothetical protein [Euryarchaeota archaeon]
MIYGQRDFKWNLLGNILKIFVSRRVKQEIASQGIKPAQKAGWIFRRLMISLFFSEDISYVVKELRERDELSGFAGIMEVPSKAQIYEFLSFFRRTIHECYFGDFEHVIIPLEAWKGFAYLWISLIFNWI